ncbi:MAG: hypothetical protein ABIR47_16635 [Candidatus Kapaibacterium sp.]
MAAVETLEEKLAIIRLHFADCIGKPLTAYETAETLLDDEEWSRWDDLPIRLFFDSADPISISWGKFEDLWIEKGNGLPFPLRGSTIRWILNSINEINPALGLQLRSVALGHGYMVMGGNDIEIWTRLLLGFDGCWVEIENALDQNGYCFHRDIPAGEFIAVLE